MVGNLKNYTKIDILRCLLKIGKPVSRAELSKALELGEGTIRSILDVLKENDLLESNKNGHYLSPKGKNIIKQIKDSIVLKKIDLSRIFPKQKKAAILLRNIRNIGKAYILRDLAVKNGADGAIIIEYENKKLNILDSKYKEDLSELKNEFFLEGKDLLVIAYSDSYRLAEHGALAVATELNKDLKNLISHF